MLWPFLQASSFCKICDRPEGLAQLTITCWIIQKRSTRDASQAFRFGSSLRGKGISRITLPLIPHFLLKSA